MSRYLLDTHVWLWMVRDPDRLRPAVRELLSDGTQELFFSAASAWEIAIKNRLGKLPLPEAPRTYVPDRVRRSGAVPLPIEHDHVLRVAELPDHHRDPFDRLLIAQAQALEVPLITSDKQFSAYEVEIVAG